VAGNHTTVSRIGISAPDEDVPMVVIARNAFTKATWIEVWKGTQKIAETPALSALQCHVIKESLSVQGS